MLLGAHLGSCLQVGDLGDVLYGFAVHPLLDAHLSKGPVANRRLPLLGKFV